MQSFLMCLESRMESLQIFSQVNAPPRDVINSMSTSMCRNNTYDYT